MKTKEMVIVTKNFGHNFTGATLATHELLKRWSKSVKKITVYTRNEGKHDELENLEVIVCKDNSEIVNKLKLKNDEDVIYYNDDHLAYLLKKANKQYYHTYHATWPEARWIDFNFFIKSFVFIHLYKIAIKNSKLEITVSNRYKNWVDKYNQNSMVIRNGLGINQEKYDKVKETPRGEVYKVIMIGNIDKRKYSLALNLFELINKSEMKIQIDIYGKDLDSELRKKLEEYKFVSFKGFVSDIKLTDYDMFINTSKNENLSIAVCEAIKVHVPVLCFDSGAMGEVIQDGDNGYVIKNNDFKEMFDKLKKIIDENYEFKFEDKTIDEFNWDKSAKIYMDNFK